MKKWEKPRLVILVRGKPEERILSWCKGFVDVQGGAMVIDEGCIQDPVNCAYCSELSDS